VRIEVSSPSGEFVATDYNDSMQLQWSAQQGGEFAAADISPKVPFFVDLVSTREAAPEFRIHVASLPYRYEQIQREPRIYRLTLRVTGDNVAGSDLRIDWPWTGVWNAVRPSIAP
jgi:hypothetical protein